jgi:AcrR family transcriptional regulator
MSGGDSESRTKMVRSAASLLSARGLTATSFSDVIADSGAPRGSIYHHFPEGKAQLTEEAIRFVAERVAAHQRGYTGTTAAGVLERFIGLWRNVVVTSQAKAGCALAGVVVDSSTAQAHLLDIARAGFRNWIEILTEQLSATGVPADHAGRIATAVLAAMEGALILCRTERDVAPLDAVAAELMRLLPQTAKP